MRAMKKIPNQNYEDGMAIYYYLRKKHGGANVRLVEGRKATDIYWYNEYFDTFDNEGEPQGYKLSV